MGHELPGEPGAGTIGARIELCGCVTKCPLHQAAPELLEALEECAGVARIEPPVTLTAARKRLAHIEGQARAAIEKAKEGA
jgi:hypothetical protein